ncbi:MAG: hypothetical protein ACRC46_05300 [Thermoguttaceae bacterium]
MNIQIQRDGTWQKVSEQEFLDMVARCVIRPDAEVVVNDQTIVAARIKGLIFPCQVSVPPPAAPQTAQAETGQFGMALVSGKGKESSIVFDTWTTMLPIIVFTFVLLCVILPSVALQKGEAIVALGVQIGGWVSEEAAIVAALTFGFGVISSFGLILYTVFIVRGAAKTEITVYDNGITGVGCGKSFALNFDLHCFQFTYDKTIVDATSTAIIVYAVGARYKCYVANPDEIQRVIVNQQQRLSI